MTEPKYNPDSKRAHLKCPIHNTWMKRKYNARVYGTNDETNPSVCSVCDAIEAKRIREQRIADGQTPKPVVKIGKLFDKPNE